MKGQLFSIDSLVAFSIFFLIMGMIAYIWIQSSLIPSFELQTRAHEIADFVVSNMMADENILNCSKLFELTLEDYEDLREKLNIGPYDFWIEIEGMDPDICPDIRPDIDVMLVLDVSGSMSITCVKDLQITTSGERKEICASKYTLEAPSKITLSSAQINLGSGQLKTLVTEDFLYMFYNTHTHGGVFPGPSYTAPPTAMAAACTTMTTKAS